MPTDKPASRSPNLIERLAVKEKEAKALQAAQRSLADALGATVEGNTPSRMERIRLMRAQARPRDLNAPKDAISAQELGVDPSLVDTMLGAPELAYRVGVKDPDTGETVVYKVLGKNKEAAQEALRRVGLLPETGLFTEDQMRRLGELKSAVLGGAEDIVDTSVDRAADFASKAAVFNSKSDLLRQLDPGFRPGGMPNAFFTGLDIGHSDEMIVSAAKIERSIPGSIAKVTFGETGRPELFVKLPTSSEFVPVDISGFPVNAGWGAVGAELEGDIGIITGNLLNAANILTSVAMSRLGRSQRGMVKRRGVHSPGKPGPIGPTRWMPRFAEYAKEQTRQLMERGLGRFTIGSLVAGTSAAFGDVVDQSIDKFRGFNHDSWGEIADEAKTVFDAVALTEGGMRIVGSGLALLTSPPIRKLIRAEDENVKNVIETFGKYDIPIVYADLHPLVAIGATQSQRLTSSARAFYNQRDVFVKSGVTNFVDDVFTPQRLTGKEAMVAARAYHEKLLAGLKDGGSTIGSAEDLSRHIYDYFAANRRVTIAIKDEAVSKLPPKGFFDIKGLQRIRQESDAAGTRYLRAGYKLGDGAMPILPDGTKVGLDVGTLRLPEEVLDPRLNQLLDSFNQMDPRLEIVGRSPDGTRNTMVDQIVRIRETAFALSDDPKLNEVSRWTAARIYQETKRIMTDPKSSTKEFKEEMLALATHMDTSEEIATALWAKRLLDPDQQVVFGEAYEIGQKFFNLERPELIIAVKDLLTSTAPGRPVPLMHRWEEAKLGVVANLALDPLSMPAKLLHPNHQKALHTIFDKSELKTLNILAEKLSSFQRGPMARYMQYHQDIIDPALEMWKSKDTMALKEFMEALGGHDSPQGRALSASMFAMLMDANTKLVNGYNVLDKRAFANAMEELRGRGWLKIMLGDDKAKMLTADVIQKGLNMMIGGSDTGSNIMAAAVAQDIAGSVLNRKRAAAGTKKWFSNYLGGRLFVSPFIFRASGIKNPQYMGPVDGKYLVPPQMSYLRLMADMYATVQAQAERDAKDMNLDSSFTAEDIPYMTGYGPQLQVDQPLSPIAPPAPPPGMNMMGLGNLPTGGGRKQPLIPPPPLMQQPPQGVRRAGGGMPTNAGAGRVPGSGPNSGRP